MKIAVYSGVIPSTTFIENLIVGLGQQHQVLLFGIQKQKICYGNNNIRIVPLYENRLIILLAAFFWRLRLALYSPKKYFKLRSYILDSDMRFGERCRLWNKYAPIVYHQPDLFHVQWTGGVAEWVFLKMLFNIKIVISFRGSQITFVPYSDEKADSELTDFLKFYDGYHAVSAEVLELAKRYHIDMAKSRIIHPAIKSSVLTNFSIRERSKKHFQLISVGRGHWVKGFDVALDACAILMRHGFDFHYTIVGAGDSEELTFQVSQLGLTNHVTLLDSIPQSEVMKRYTQSDLLVLSSHVEGIPNVVLEAMGCGTPVVSTRCGGIEGIILHGNNGWLVPIRNADTLARQIIEIAELNHQEIQRVVTNAKNTIEKDYMFDKQLMLFNELYTKVMAG